MPLPMSSAAPGLLARLTVASLVASSGSVWAGADAGTQIRRYQDETLQRLAPRPATATPATPAPLSRAKAAAQASDARVRVTGFDVHGVTRFSAAEIATLLQPFVGQTLDTAGLHAVADTLHTHYRQAGYFIAKVFVPPQELSEVLRLDVYEGYLDTQAFEVVGQGQRVAPQVVQDILQANIDVEAPVHRASFERALLLAEDLPGVTTASTLYPGEHIGSARLRTVLSDLPLLSGNVDADNFGHHTTGQTRLGTTLYLNSPTQVGDQAVARWVSSGHGSRYAYLTYLRPVSPTGTRLGASIDHLGYDARAIEGLGRSDGRASDARLYLTHPLLRSRHSNLHVRADLSQLDIDDRNDLQINARRQIRSATLTLHGDDDHAVLGAGLSVFDASVTVGRVDIRGNAAYQAVDQTNAQTAGGFSRLNFSLSRLQQLDTRWSVLARVRGQLASGNLDTSQKMYLGGAGSVSGYPLGEAGGDQGLDWTLELRRAFAPPWGGTLSGTLFYQQGRIKNHKTTWPGWQGSNPIITNHITMKTVGVGLVQTLDQAWVLRGLVGWQLGDNAMRNPTTGATSDGSTRNHRAWLQAIRYF